MDKAKLEAANDRFNDVFEAGRGRFREGMSIAQSIYRPLAEAATIDPEIVDKIAAEIAETRRQTLEIVRHEAGFPGLQGISQKAGASSVEAILDDMTRNIGHALANTVPGFHWATFMPKAGVR